MSVASFSLANLLESLQIIGLGHDCHSYWVKYQIDRPTELILVQVLIELCFCISDKDDIHLFSNFYSTKLICICLVFNLFEVSRILIDYQTLCRAITLELFP